MKFPFFTRSQTQKIVVASSSKTTRQAEKILADILASLPDMLLGYVYDMQHNTLLASYTVSAAYNPHQLTVRNAKVLQTVREALAARAWAGGPCTELLVMLDDQMHYLRPLEELGWYCFVAVQLAGANMGMVKEVVRRAVSPEAVAA